MNIVMPPLSIFLTVISLGLLVYVILSLSVKEKYIPNTDKIFYGRSGIPAIPLNIPIPNQPIKDFGDGTFIDYRSANLKNICPSKPGTHCNSIYDCGPAELCINQAGWFSENDDNIQPQSSVCVCSIQNSCVSGENIC